MKLNWTFPSKQRIGIFRVFYLCQGKQNPQVSLILKQIIRDAAKEALRLRWNLALTPRETKDTAYKTLVRPRLEYASPIWNPYIKCQVNQLEKVQRTAARWTCRHWRNASHVGGMLNELERPTLEDRREQASFHKIHSGTVAVERNKYLTPAPRLRQTRASHQLQYTMYHSYLWRAKTFLLSQHHSSLKCTASFCGLCWVHRGVQVSYLGYKVRGVHFSMPLIN